MTVQEENSSLIKEPLGKSSAQVHLRKMLTEESLFKNSSEPSIRMAKHQPPLLLDGMMSRTQDGPLLASLQHQVLLACNV
jgi:hypothetical protein